MNINTNRNNYLKPCKLPWTEIINVKNRNNLYTFLPWIWWRRIISSVEVSYPPPPWSCPLHCPQELYLTSSCLPILPLYQSSLSMLSCFPWFWTAKCFTVACQRVGYCCQHGIARLYGKQYAHMVWDVHRIDRRTDPKFKRETRSRHSKSKCTESCWMRDQG